MKNKKTKFRQIFALFLVMVLCITMQDMTVFAAETAETEQKSETIEITGVERYDEEYYAEPELRFPIEQKRLYSQARAGQSLEEYVVAALENHETEIDVAAYNISRDDAGEEYFRIINNNPQLCYVERQFQYRATATKVTKYIPNYLVGKEEAVRMTKELEASAQQVLEQVDDSMNAVQKALVVHDYLVQNCEYDYESYLAGTVPAISHTSYGALVKGAAVCEGYAGAYMYIMKHKLGISCTMVSSDEMNHAWNMIEIDGKWYHVDLTWDDPVWDRIGRVPHNYFLLSDSAISNKSHSEWTQDHIADSAKYDKEFWIDVESAISYYNGAWYYSGYDWEKHKVVLVKKTNLFGSSADTVYEASPKQNWGLKCMFLARANDTLYFNTSTQIMQLDKKGTVQVFYEPDDLEGKQIFGFTVKDGVFLYAPDTTYPSGKQSDIRSYPRGETGADEGVENLKWMFMGLDGTSVVTGTDPGKTTVLIFGSTGCPNTKKTLESIAASQWVHRSDIRVIFAECQGASLEDVKSFIADYGCDEIIGCYDTDPNIFIAMWEYYHLIYPDSNNVILPVTVLIDGKDRIRHCLTGYQAADDILDKMKASDAAGPSAKPSPKPTNPSPKPGQKPVDPSPKPGQKPAQKDIPTKNSIIQDTSGNTYQVTRSDKANGTVAYVKATKNKATKVNVPSKVTINNITYEVTSISAKAFRGNTKLKKVVIGKNVTSIGNSAFEGCKALKSIVIPSKVRSVGKNAFKNCKKLKSIRIKGKVLKKVGKNAFKGIHAKAKIKVPKKQLKAYKKRLKGKGQKKTVKIIR